ncbi:MAG TPA: DUF2996 domain-containing protein [Chroococcidiopsis sp.]
MPDETNPTPAESKAAAPAAKAERPPKKEKPPALEDKPFADFINQDFLPSLQKTLKTLNVDDAELTFAKTKLPVQGLSAMDECWQVSGRFRGGKHSFIIGFLKEDIQGQKFFACADYGSTPSVLESFMIDERKVSLDLLVLYTIQRLNGQKWLLLN